MKNPTISPYTRRRDGKEVFRVYDPFVASIKGRVYVGCANSREEAAAMWKEYLETGKRFTRVMGTRKKVRACWIVERKGANRFELYGHDHDEDGRHWIGSAKTREEAEAAKAAYLLDATKPKRMVSPYTPRKYTPRAPRQTRECVQVPKPATHQPRGVQPLTDDRREMMRRMLARIG